MVPSVWYLTVNRFLVITPTNFHNKYHSFYYPSLGLPKSLKSILSINNFLIFLNAVKLSGAV